MRALRVVLVATGLALCTCAAARVGESGKTRDRASAPAADADGARGHHSLFARILKMVRSGEDGGGELAQATTEKESKQHQQQHQHQTKSGDLILEIFPRDLRKKENFLINLTGPLYFSRKCRKHVYRLYHNTRDCTIPAYYRRCARLLTRLARSPKCLES